MVERLCQFRRLLGGENVPSWAALACILWDSSKLRGTHVFPKAAVASQSICWPLGRGLAGELADRRMLSDEAKRSLEQSPSRLGAMPGRSSGGMRERNKILSAPVELEFPASANNVRKRVKFQKLGDCESAYGKD